MKNLKYDPDKVDDYSKKELAEMIFNGGVSREQVNEDGLFRKHRPMLDKELSLMGQEEQDWTEATKLNTKESYQSYLDKYNPTIVESETITDGWVDNTVYVGRHVKDAFRLQADIKERDDNVLEKNSDNVAWAEAMATNTIESYKIYISIYDKQSSEYRGQYVDEAKLKINQLQDKSDWDKAVSFDTIESYKTYLSIYDAPTSSYRGAFISEAKQAIDRLTPRPVVSPVSPVDPLKDEAEDWAEALTSNDIAGYKKYISIYQNKNGKHLEEAKQKLNQLDETDDREWGKASKANTLTAYRLYVSKFDGNYAVQKGKHLEEAKIRINRIMDDDCWANAVKQNTKDAYQDYLQKYPHGSHAYDAQKRIQPPVPPTPWSKYVMVLFIVAACVFLVRQYWNKDWPFSQEKKEKHDDAQIAAVDSLQWAIDNQDIPLLTKYAEMDSTRAYYPLALALNAEDSIANVEKTLHWSDLVLDPDVNSLHQNIINDIQEKELNELESRFAAINPNEKNADRKYLEVYKDYVSHFERLATHTPRIINRYMPIEDMANAQIKDRQNHEELRTSILREWETQHSKLKTILSQIEANEKKAYSSNH